MKMKNNTMDPNPQESTLGKSLSKSAWVYPFALQEVHLADDALVLYEQWLNKTKRQWNALNSPCLPIGKIGPSLVFAHYAKAAIKSSEWPLELFQHVVISEDQYSKLFEYLDLIFQRKVPLNHLAQKEWTLNFPTIVSKDDFLEFILNEFVVEDSIRPFLIDLQSMSHWSLLDLPNGYSQYFYYLKSQTAIVPIQLAEISSSCFELIPKCLQERYNAICFAKYGSTIYVANAQLKNIEFEDLAIAKSNGVIKEVVPCMACADWIAEKRQDYIKAKKKEILQLTQEVPQNKTQEEGKGNLEIDIKLVESLDIKNGYYSPEIIFQWLLYEAINRDVTDIHIEYCYERGRIRFRMDGDLVPFYESTQEVARALVTVCKNICSMSSNVYDNQDASFSVKYDGQKINLRVNAIPFRKHTQKLALRILPKKNSLTSLDKLGLSEAHLSILRRAITRKQGLILITGPTGEGKTTTLYAALSEINKPNINIQTVEDPIEREIEGVNQTAVDFARGITFQSIMRSIVRQDPNVILLGEIRDQESAELAIEAALTGHLVFSTLHSNSAIKAIQRLMQLNVPHYLLADSLILIQAQRLIKRLCNRCKKQREISAEERLFFSDQKLQVPAMIYEAKGCVHCDNTGYSGRIAIMEMVPIGTKISEKILQKESFLKIQEFVQSQGVRNLYQDALLKVSEGTTSLEQAMMFEEVWT